MDQTGALDAGMVGAKSLRSNLTGGGLGDKLYDWIHGDDALKNGQISKKGNIPLTMDEINAPQQSQNPDLMADAVEKGMTRAMSSQQRQTVLNNRVNIKIQNGDGKVSNKTHK
jgi:hypothetical protein